MRLDASPPLADSKLAAIRVALERANIRLGEQPVVYTSAWRHAAVREAVDDESGPGLTRELERYARSPRSTRGATRA